MRRFIVTILFGCIFSSPVLLAQSSASTANKPEFVMILSSYSYDKEWSTTLAKEIRNNLETRGTGIRTYITYADIAARTSFLADRFAMQGAFANGRLNNQIRYPDVLVLIGDESWMLYRVMNHRGVWENIPVVLCGVHAEVMRDYRQFFPDKQLADTSFIPLSDSATKLHTSAVIEPNNAARTLQLAQTLVPQLQRLYYLSDGSYADVYMREKLMQSGEEQGIGVTEILVERGNADSVKTALGELPDKAVVVTNGVPVPQDVHVPVLTLRDMAFQSHIPAGGYFAPISAFADKASETVFRILQTGGVDETPYVVAPDTAFYLNGTALMHAGLRHVVGDLPGAVESNIPPPFLIRHIRVVVIVLLMVIVLAFVTVRSIHSHRYSRNLNLLFERYKTLYNEYEVVYENMPVGLMLFDVYGNLLKRNAETDTFLELFAHSKSSLFHLFDIDILDEAMREALFRKELVSRLIYFQEYCYRIQCCMIADEETGNNQILVIAIDNTEIEKEKKAKEEISNVLNFAMNKAVIGVAEYNLMDGVGFATDAWYDTLDIERGITDFRQAHRCLVPDDRERVQRYLEQVRYGASHLFLASLQMQTRAGETHYIHYLIQPLEYAPDKKHIVIAELLFNMDDQIAKERELEIAMKKAQEADRFKNAFVANMKDEIRVPLKEIIVCAQELVGGADMERRDELTVRIEAANERILKLLNNIIEVSKVEMDNNT